MCAISRQVLHWSPAPDQTPQPHPLLFVHGACLDPRCFDDFMLPYLSHRGFDCYALSLRQHETQRGYWVWNTARIQDYVEDVAEVVSQLPAPPILIGHSMGGYIIMKYLEQYTNISGSVLLSSIPVTGFGAGFWRTMRLYLLEHLWHVVTLRRNLFRVTAQQFDRYCFRYPMQADRLALYHSRLHLESFLAILDMVVMDLPKPAQAALLPMLVMGGAHDVIFGVNQTEATARAYRADCHIFHDLAHDIIREEGYDRTCEQIIAWLREKGLAQ